MGTNGTNSYVMVPLSVSGPLAGMIFNKTKGITRCPKCGRNKLNYDLAKNVFHCFYSGCEYSGNGLTAYADAYGYASNKDAYKAYVSGEGSKEITEQTMEQTMKLREVIETEKKETSPLASPDVIDKTLRELINVLSLSDEHRTSLEARGFEDISGFRSVYKNPDWRKSVARKLIQSGCDLRGVPGFFKKDGVWELVCMGNGILVPYYSPTGIIVGAQIRNDAERSGQKYVWLSSSGRPKAKTLEFRTKARSEVSWCGGYEITTSGKIPRIPQDKTVYLTEGAMKGQLAYQLSGRPFIAVAGVNCLKQLKVFLEEMKNYGVRKIAIAYDMDRFQNPGVAKALKK